MRYIATFSEQRGHYIEDTRVGAPASLTHEQAVAAADAMNAIEPLEPGHYWIKANKYDDWTVAAWLKTGVWTLNGRYIDNPECINRERLEPPK